MACRCSLAASLLLVLGCSSNGEAFGVDGGDAGDAALLDVRIGFNDAGDANIATSCSGDLRSVIDSNGNVVMTCPPDQGCKGGQCVAACQAAAASQGSVGCDYTVPTPSFYYPDKPPCFAVFVANNWPMDATVTVTRSGTTYDPTQFGRIAQAGVAATSWAAIPSTGIPPGDVAVLFMSHDPSAVNLGNPITCPVTPAVSQADGSAVPGSNVGASSVTARGAAFQITTDIPVTMYDILPYGGASSYLPSAELLFPTSAWSTNYLGVVPQRGNYGYPQWGQIVAMQDNTQVTVFPNITLPSSGTVASAPQGTSTVFDLSAGEYIQWQDSNEMSGTIIQSNNPIGFFGGTTYDCYSSATSTGGGCDSAHQQIPPISAMANEYVIAPYTTRMASLAPEVEKYRVIGTQAGTTLTFDPPISAAPSTLTEGQVADFDTSGGFVVKSQDSNHPFFIAQFMTGCEVTGGSRPGCSAAAIKQFGSCCLGDEEYVIVMPPAQFLQKYVFFTDPTYPTTNLVFVRAKTTTSFQDVTLDCVGAPLTGWTAIDAAGNFQFTNIDLIRASTGNGSCDNGPHVATSNGPFGLTVWGLDTFSSYAYPAGGNVAPINSVVVPPSPH